VVLTGLIIITNGCQAKVVGDGDSVGGIGGVTNHRMSDCIIVGLEKLEDVLLGLSVDDQLARELGNIYLFLVGAFLNEDSLSGGSGSTQGCNGLADLLAD
jgi:hypothetical protein